MSEFIVILLRQPQKYLNKQSDRDAEFIRQGLDKLRVLNGDIKAMQGMKGFYRLRVRDWRIIFEIVDERIVVHAIGPRGDVYK